MVKPTPRGVRAKIYAKRARYFSAKNAAKVDIIMAEIGVASAYDPLLTGILITSLMLAADRVDSTTGLFKWHI